jgi:hypothetical protein
MDAATLKIVLDLQSKLYNRVLSDILLAIHHDSEIVAINYNLGSPTDETISGIMHDLRQLKSKAKLFDELPQQSNNGDSR